MRKAREEDGRGEERHRDPSTRDRLAGFCRAHALGSAALLVPLSTLLVLHYGQRGFLPLDQSIVFEGGNALRCGRVPFVDLSAPSGLPLFLIQRALSSVLGWSWLAYLVHGAALNAVAALVAFSLVAHRYRSRAVPLLVGLATALVFVPPIGTPYPDHGSFLFSGLALLLADRAGDASGGRRVLLLLSAGATWGVAWLCKPIPALFLLPPVLLAARPVRGLRNQLAAQVSIVLVGSAIGILAPLLAAGASPGAYYARGLAPLLAVGGGRLEHLFADSAHPPRSLVAAEWRVPLLLWAAIAGGSRLFHRGLAPPVETRQRRRSLLLSTCLLGASFGYACLTFRDAGTSLGWFPLAAALAAAPGSRLRSATSAGPETRALRQAAGWAIGLACVGWLIAFHLRVNVGRSALLMNLEDRLPPTAAAPGLEWLDAVTPEFTGTDGESLRKVLEYLDSRPEPVFLLGDSSVIYGLSGHCSPSPVLWFHPHLTVPWKDGRATEEFQEGLIGVLPRSGVAAVIVENGGTQMGVTPDTLPRVRDWVASRTVAKREFGSFAVFELSPHPGQVSR